MPQPEANPVRAAIERAFAAVPYPGDDGLCLATTDDEGVADHFRGRTWAGHRVADLRYHSCALSFFTDAALHYYLPAFMLAVLEDRGAADILDLDLLNLFGSPWYRIGRLLPRLSAPQVDAVRAYLEHRSAVGRAEEGEAAWGDNPLESTIRRGIDLLDRIAPA